MLFALAYGIEVVTGNAAWRTVALASVWTTLALLQKVTTALPVVVVLGIAWLVVGWVRGNREHVLAWSEWLKAVAAWGLPLAISVAWNAYADGIKGYNALGMYLTSRALMTWNLGTFSDRLSTRLWAEVVLSRGIYQNMGSGFGAALVALALGWRNRRRSTWVIVGALTLYFSTLLIFTNLHIVHDYYQVSCTVFLVGAVAVALGEWLPRVVSNRGIWVGAVCVVMAASLYQIRAIQYGRILQPITAQTNRTLAVAEEIRRSTAASAAILVYGFDSSSEVAYYAERRSLTVPAYFHRLEETLTTPEKFLGGTIPGAVVICPGGGVTPEAADRLLGHRDHYSRRAETFGCSLLLR